MIERQRPWLSQDNDIFISGSTVLQALTCEEFRAFDVDVYCKPKAWFTLYHHLVSAQRMSVVGMHDKRYMKNNRYIHSVVNFRRNVGANIVPKYLQVIVLFHNDIPMQEVINEFDFNVVANIFDGNLFFCSSIYSVVHKSILCHKRKRLDESRIRKYKKRGYSFCNLHYVPDEEFLAP